MLPRRPDLRTALIYFFVIIAVVINLWALTHR